MYVHHTHKLISLVAIQFSIFVTMKKKEKEGRKRKLLIKIVTRLL